MKIQCLKSIIDDLNPNSEIAIYVKRSTDAASVLTYDVDYNINEYGEIVLSVADIDSDGETRCLYDPV